MANSARCPDGRSVPTPWVEDLFARLTAILGSSVATLYAGADPDLVKAAWGEALGGLSTAEIKRGLAATRTRKFAPNLPEFLHLCRPALDPEVAWHEAEQGMRMHAQQQPFEWSHPAVFWAARDFAFELRTSNFAACRKRWEPLLAKTFALRVWPAIPDPMAKRLPQQSVVANPARVQAAVARLRLVRKDLTGFHTKAEQDEALARADTQALQDEPGVSAP